jgi:hypothetical protein
VTSSAVFALVLSAAAPVPVDVDELPLHAANESVASATETAATVRRMITNPPA